MKVSRQWLQKHFKDELPSTKELADLLTFHAFEIEEYDDDMLDVKVLPDRAAYALSHRGIAYELAAILDTPLSYDPLAQALPVPGSTDEIALSIDTPKANRHMGALVRGVKVGPSPDWLKASLESVGQRSINNIVDATNCVTLAMGQPLHAFDAAKIAKTDGKIHVGIRETLEGEKVKALTGEEYTLPEGTLVLCEGPDGQPLDIAGIRGGASSAITDDTTDLFVSVANFDAASVRRAARALSLWTDASLRFQNNPSAELVPFGMGHILALIQQVAGGDVVGVNDLYPNQEPEAMQVPVSVASINGRLGADFSKDEIEGVFKRLLLNYVETEDGWTVTAPFYRRDVVIPEDIAEEVGRILGYDRLAPTLLSAGDEADLRRYRGIERVKDMLVERGFTEISTQSFAAIGDVKLANPLQDDRPYLRSELAGNIHDAVARAVLAAPRVLGPVKDVRLFEIGNVFGNDGERLSLAVGYAPVSGKKQPVLEEVATALSELLNMSTSPSEGVIEFPLGEVDLEALGEEYEPAPVSLSSFRMFSSYPFAIRDIAVWTPEGTEEIQASDAILAEAGDLLARIDLFDQFQKDGKTSYAFRLIFESSEKTLADTDLDPIMARITDALNGKDGWTVR